MTREALAYLPPCAGYSSSSSSSPKKSSVLRQFFHSCDYISADTLQAIAFATLLGGCLPWNQDVTQVAVNLCAQMVSQG